MLPSPRWIHARIGGGVTSTDTALPWALLDQYLRGYTFPLELLVPFFFTPFYSKKKTTFVALLRALAAFSPVPERDFGPAQPPGAAGKPAEGAAATQQGASSARCLAQGILKQGREQGPLASDYKYPPGEVGTHVGNLGRQKRPFHNL